MRKQTEISIVAKRPHLFHESTLIGLAIKEENHANLKSTEADFSLGYKQSNFFECGEGWLPIILAFTESIDHFIDKDENSNAENEISVKCPTALIDGAYKYQNRLCIVIDLLPNIDEDLLNKIKAIKEFSKAMSGFICEVCGATLKKVEENKPVKCIVCNFRHNSK